MMKLNACKCGGAPGRERRVVCCSVTGCWRLVQADTDKEADTMWNLANPVKAKPKKKLKK